MQTAVVETTARVAGAGPYPLAGLQAGALTSVVRVGSRAVFGERRVMVIAGPCAVENAAQMRDAARAAAAAGAVMLRGGAYKPRTSPYSFQGLERQGYELLAEAGREVGLPTVSEVVDEESLALALDYVDMLQVGSRNMQNFRLLRAVARTGRPVLLKRGLAATVEEWLMAAEYILSGGNDQVVLCERGIRTFETATRNTLDLSAVALVKRLSHLPVIVDPSHATGNPDLITPMSCAAVAAGADGLIVEMHPRPQEALCDGKQSLTPDAFAAMMRRVEAVCPAVGREL